MKFKHYLKENNMRSWALKNGFEDSSDGITAEQHYFLGFLDSDPEEYKKARDKMIKKQKMKKIFLGGTCNESTWRDDLIKDLKLDYFNPVVDDWTEEDYQEELKQRKECDYCLYVITPKMTGVYSIAEVVDDSNKQPKKTIFCIKEKDGDRKFEKGQLKSLDKVGVMVDSNGGLYVKDYDKLSSILNTL